MRVRIEARDDEELADKAQLALVTVAERLEKALQGVCDEHGQPVVDVLRKAAKEPTVVRPRHKVVRQVVEHVEREYAKTLALIIDDVAKIVDEELGAKPGALDPAALRKALVDDGTFPVDEIEGKSIEEMRAILQGLEATSSYSFRGYRT